MNSADKLLANVAADPNFRRLGPIMYRNMRQLIIDEMPCGEHRERARLWRKLAARCLEAADKHDAVADRREKTARVVRSFAPPFREAALQAIIRGELAIEMDQTLEEHVPPIEGWADPTLAGEDGSLGLRAGRAWGCPDNGTWRRLTASERQHGIRTRAGMRPMTIQEDRDDRTSEPPAWYFESAEEIEEA